MTRFVTERLYSWLNILCDLVFLKNLKISAKKITIFTFGIVVAISFLWQFGFFDWFSNASSTFWKWINAHGEKDELRAMVSRNHGGFILASIGICLVVWGRIIAHRSYVQEKEQNIHERYEKAARMLSDETMSARIAGCRALRALAKDDKNMWSPCAGLLFGYIKSPYLSAGEKIRLGKELGLTTADKQIPEYEYDSSDLIELFNIDKNLRTDIQEAADSISAIYKYAYDRGDIVNDVTIQLPSYFLKNLKKGKLYLANGSFESLNVENAFLRNIDLENAKFEKVNLSFANLEEANLLGAELQEANLHGAILRRANLKGADLSGADLQGSKLRDAVLEKTNLEEANLFCADLQKVNLSGAILTRADITSANFKGIKHLTKEQILSAQWGINEKGEGEMPTLPDKFMEYGKIKEWSKPHYDINSDSPLHEQDNKKERQQDKTVKNEDNPPKKLSEIMPIKNLWQYKVHCGDRNTEGIEPLDVFADGEWGYWQEPWGNMNRFNRKYIFTIMKFYHEPNLNTWLFGGIYEIKNRSSMNNYDVELTNQGKEYIGRLKIRFKLEGRNRYRKFEGIYDDMEVVEILPESYKG